MSAPTLSVRTLNARYRVGLGGDEHRQLDGLLDRVLDDAIEPALARAQADSPGELVCIRRVDAPVRLALAGGSDGALAAAWADAIAAAIACCVRAGGHDVVRYGSLRHALLDMALCVATGDERRAWAWRSLGLWPAEVSEPARALVLALVADGPAVTPVLARVARAGKLGGLVARVAPSAWLELAVAALCGAGAQDGVARRALATGGSPAAERVVVRRARDRSALAAALAATGAPVVAICALALVEVQPAAVVALGEHLVGALAIRLPSPPSAPTPEDASPQPQRAAGDEPSVSAPRASRGDYAPAATAAGSTSTSHADPAAPDVQAPAEAAAHATEQPSHVDDAVDAEPLAVAPRARGESAFGGLVFVVHAVVGLDLPSRFAEQLPDLELHRALHAMALALAAGAEPGDAAALAFAGLAPDSDPPEPLPVEDAATIDAAVCDTRDWLAARLGCEPEHLELGALLARRARVVADPGWIEVHLDAREIDTAVRRAGLDLDPDHLPFLGCVMRIVYA